MYINKAQYEYQACKDKHNKSMQDINKRQREREWAIANTRDLFRGSSTLALHPRLRHTKDFHYARSQWISPWCRNTYNPSDSLVPYTRKPHKLAEAAPQTKSSQSNSKPPRAHLPASSKYKEKIFGDHNTLITLQKLSLQHTYRII